MFGSPAASSGTTIRSAKKSIYVAIFVISKGKDENDPVNVLLRELVAAVRRGVDVKVVVENPRSPTGKLYEKNAEALKFLEEGGVETAFDQPRRELHDKFVLIDEDTVFIGNHNWSKASLKLNREVSVMVKSSPADPDFLKHFSRIKHLLMNHR